MIFERVALGFLAAMVIVLVTAIIAQPPVWATLAPKGALAMTAQSLAIEPAALSTTLAPPSADPARKPGLKGLEPYPGSPARPTARKLSDTFTHLDYDLETVLSGKGRVPRLFLARLPKDLAEVRDNKLRKAVFFQTLLPLILQVNEGLLAERRRLWRLQARQRLGGRLDAVDRLWLTVMADRYRVKRGDMDALLQRVDVIPPSLALAQGAEESGWGTSRFVREGNAIFGQWTFSEDGNLVPRQRDEGKKHTIRAFDSILDSVRAYARNLNTHRAYGNLRRLRATMRRNGEPIDGNILAGTLTRYSARGGIYIETLRTIIRVNGLHRLDDARLHDAIGGGAKPLI
jgi:Bax protein